MTKKTVEDFEAFLKAIGEKDESRARRLLKQINLDLVKNYYEDNPTLSRPKELIDAVVMLKKSFGIEDEYEKLKAKAWSLVPPQDKRCPHCAGMNAATATVCEKCGNSF